MFEIEFKKNGFEIPVKTINYYMKYNSISSISSINVDWSSTLNLAKLFIKLRQHNKDLELTKNFYFTITLNNGQSFLAGENKEFVFNGNYWIDQNISIWSYFRKEITWKEVWCPSMILNSEF